MEEPTQPIAVDAILCSLLAMSPVDELLEKIASRPLRAQPLQKLEQLLTERPASPIRRFFELVARHELGGFRWKDWEFYAAPRITAKLVTTGMFADGSLISHSMKRNDFGATFLTSDGEKTALGAFSVFVEFSSSERENG